MMLALLALLLPAAIALLIGVLHPLRYAGKPAAYLSVVGALISVGCAVMLFMSHGATEAYAVPWLKVGGATIATVGVHLDGVSLSMLLVVTIVALCVQVFSLEYLHDEPPAAFGRYYAYQSLFLFSMSLLVLAPNLMQLFIGWELVGVTSYLLIGYWYKKPSAARAAMKAFWVTKLADSGFVVGLVVLFATSGQLGWGVTLPPETATVVTLLLFMAVLGKSAQEPLHVWLPDAMEGPTPVSALLHAATMVAAGVYLIVRADPLFQQAPDTQTVMAWFGGATALFAACVAVVQTDIKKVLAYSTCSQLGYMVAGLGAGSMLGGFFHLTTHAAFKALLFLAAGSVIHAVHSNELTDMGGLRKKMPFTTAMFVIGALALAGIPGMAGFFSKDMVLEAVAHKGLMPVTAALLLSAGLTAFYMGRVVFLAFFGPVTPASGHSHEPGASMAGPLLVLAVPSVLLGWFAAPFARNLGVEPEAFHLGTVGMIAIAMAVGGIGLAWMLYGSKSLSPSAFNVLAPLGKLARGSAIDSAWLSLYRGAGMGLARLAGWIDRYIVDALVNVVGWAVIASGRSLRAVQTGDVQDYLFAVFVAAADLGAFGVFA